MIFEASVDVLEDLGWTLVDMCSLDQLYASKTMGEYLLILETCEYWLFCSELKFLNLKAV